MTRERRGLPEGVDPDARVEAATALRRLGHALVGHNPDSAVLHRIRDLASDLADSVESSPRRSRSEEMALNGRFAEAIRAGSLHDLVADGDAMELFRDSVVSGAANPMGIGLTARREGDEAVAEVVLGAAFEGAPDRSHGGVVAAIIDETMGFVLPIIGLVAFTGHLGIDFLAPTPLHRRLEFRARLRGRDGRQLTIDAEGRDRDLVFVRATATFVEIPLASFTTGAPNGRRSTRDRPRPEP